MSKEIKCLTVDNEELAKVCSQKIENGWTIEFVTPDSLKNIKSGSSVLTYKILVSRDKKEYNEV